MSATWLGLAQRQGGAITASQLCDVGVSRRQRDAMLRDGWLMRLGHGSFALPPAGQDPSAAWCQAMWIAILAAGPGAVAFRRSAGACWRLDGVPFGCVEVAVPGSRGTRRSSVHRLRSLTLDVVTRAETPWAPAGVSGMPVTSLARTLVDLGGVLPDAAVERALECALRRKLVTIPDLVAVVGGPRVPGRASLARVLERRPDGAPPTESDAETLFLHVARAAGLPEPARQWVVLLRGRRYRVDFAWPELRIAVEIDGYETHGSQSALQRDLRRQNRIVLDGWVILRFTGSDVEHRASREVVPDLLAAWALRGGVARVVR